MSVCLDKTCPMDLLELERETLHRILESNEFDLQNKNILKASQRMDRVILYWYHSKKATLKQKSTMVKNTDRINAPFRG
ncbi:hypothetical protein [Candidatus Formimonas warabiya]|uniref:Uncharacterized protein n=1 Tax=Formimonas warabiya TaxID=1761012 RepID=A0A3G1KMM2_FORW1|nr:hypothetical protein [Candidatus Formimonas warabiya]ATW23707.1 hypothetical protein DCMF_01885 [Candidatus Formimonas warabiya]